MGEVSPSGADRADPPDPTPGVEDGRPPEVAAADEGVGGAGGVRFVQGPAGHTQLGGALDAVANAVVITDRHGAIEWANAAWERLTGYAQREVIGQNPRLLKSGVQADEFYERLWRTILAGEVWRDELVNRRKDGSLYHEEETITPIRDERGRVTHFVAVKQDITERKRVEEELRTTATALERTVAELAREKARAESADRLKSAFLATMSHELRTPLNSILGFTGVLVRELPGPLNDEQRRQLGMVQSSARHLLALINDVLDLSKIEAGQLVVVRAPFDLPALLRRVVATVEPLAGAKGLRLEVDLSAELGRFTSDERRVEQILLNVLGNAVKFTDTGHVRLDASALAGGRVELRVSDTGCGIRPEDMGALFAPFRQLETEGGRSREGTGLGLAICRRLAALLGGQIRVVSEPGAGSTFVVELPGG
ncbi:MAG: PAS domain S-box protein [Polyangiaceae bacterium]|nr:PAS domain S-box protein [Polyangiaceae bacterium]